MNQWKLTDLTVKRQITDLISENLTDLDLERLIVFKEFENLSVEKMTLSTALGFEPRS